MTYDPAAQPPPPEPTPRKSSTTKIVLIVVAVVLLLGLICCGGLLVASYVGMGQVAKQLATEPAVVENFGEAEVEMTLVPPSNVAERLSERGIGYAVFEADGAEEDGYIIARQAGDGRMVPVEIILSDGTVINLEE